MNMVFEIKKQNQYLIILVEEWKIETESANTIIDKGRVKLVSDGKEIKFKDDLVFERITHQDNITYALIADSYDETYQFNEVKQYIETESDIRSIRNFYNNTLIDVKEDYYETNIAYNSAYMDHIIVDYSSTLYKIRQIFNPSGDIFVLLDYSENGEYVPVKKIENVDYDKRKKKVVNNKEFKDLNKYLYRIVQVTTGSYEYKYGYCFKVDHGFLNIIILSQEMKGYKVSINPSCVKLFNLCIGDKNLLPVNDNDEIDNNIIVLEGYTDPIADQIDKANNYKIELCRKISLHSDISDILYYYHNILLLSLKVNTSTGSIIEIKHFNAHLNEYEKVRTDVPLIKDTFAVHKLKLFVLKEYFDNEESEDNKIEK